MTKHSEPSPALAYLKKNGVVVGVIAAILGSAGFFIANQMSDTTPAAAEVRPTVLSTAGFGAESPAAASSSASAGPAARPSAAGAPTSYAGVTGAAGGPDAAARPTATSSPTVTEYPQTTVTVGTGPQAPTEQDWKINAKGFAAAWSKPSVGKEAWLRAIRPHVTDSLYKQFQLTDIRTVPSESLQSVSQDRHYGGAIVYHPLFSSGKNQFQGLMKIQPNGVWLVDQVDAPAK